MRRDKLRRVGRAPHVQLRTERRARRLVECGGDSGSGSGQAAPSAQTTGGKGRCRVPALLAVQGGAPYPPRREARRACWCVRCRRCSCAAIAGPRVNGPGFVGAALGAWGVGVGFGGLVRRVTVMVAASRTLCVE